MSAKSLSEVVYKAIFPPEGAIPLKAKRNIQAIDARIKEIEDLAEGRAVEGMTRRISSRSESQSLTEQIVQLRDSCNPPMSYREIMKRLGHVITPDAARNRYDDYKQKLLNAEAYAAMSGESQQKTEMPDHIADSDEMIQESGQDPTIRECRIVKENAKVTAQLALQEAKPEQFEEATIRNSRIVQESAEVEPDDATLRNVAATSEVEKEVTSEATKQPQNSHILDLTRKEGEYGRYVVPVPEDVVAEILRLSHEEGTPVRGISNTLAEKGVLIDWRRVRGVISNASRGDTKKHREEVRKAEEAALRSAAIEDGFSPLSDQVRAAKCDPVHPEATASPSLPGAEGAPEVARANPRGTPEEERPAPKSIARAELNIRIWDAYQAGDSIGKISADLNSEGYYYDERQVRNRLRQQGANL